MTDERRLYANSDVKTGPSPGLGLGEVSQNARALIHWGFRGVLRKNSLVFRNFVNCILILHCFQKSSWKCIQLEILTYFGSSSVWKIPWFKVLSCPVVSVLVTPMRECERTVWMETECSVEAPEAAVWLGVFWEESEGVC